MKKEIKIMNMKNGVFTLETKKTENYDEFTYYVGPCKGDEIRSYALYDKNTGVEVCYGQTKEELLIRYECIKERYAKFRKEKYYKKLINQYKELLEKEKEKKRK